mgnify:CR=1 FL=1
MFSLLTDDIVYSLQKAGGISRYWRNLQLGLKERDVRFEAYRRSDAHGAPPIDNGQEVKSVNRHLPRNVDRYLPLQCTGSTADVFHSSYYRVPLGTDYGVVTTVHDFAYERYNTGLRALVHHKQKMKSIRSADRVICVSRATADDLLSFLPSASVKTEVVYHGLNPRFFGARHADRALALPEPYVVFVGLRGGYKNFRAVAQWWRSQRRYNLMIVGGGSLSSSERSSLASNMPLLYRHAPLATEDDLIEIYHRAHALLYPSLLEGFGMPLLEAMAAECPVVASDIPVFREVAGDAATLVDPTPTGISGGVDQLRSVRRREELRVAGVARAKQFSWNDTIEQTIQVYEAIRK